MVELKAKWPPIGQEQAASKQCLLAGVLMDDLQKLKTDCDWSVLTDFELILVTNGNHENVMSPYDYR